LRSLIDTVLNDLDRKEFFIPFTEEELDAMFDEEKVVTYGAYDDDKLVASAQLYLSENFLSEIKDILDLKDSLVAELGGAVVLKEYRNVGIMKKLIEILIEEAKKRGYNYLTATVHPDNVASNNVAASTGAQIVKTVNLSGYLRNVYLLDIRKSI
ncbi:MAG TPA: hypothetical protein DCY94_05410, partial [Firmicutes bacterium]|nr:hypothetical protein [Bacillota bacterium]